MTAAQIGKLPPFSLPRSGLSCEQRRAEGQSLCGPVPREPYAEWKPPKTRQDLVRTFTRRHQGRQLHLVPLRTGRMAASPFCFLRGSACVMGTDLFPTPITGITACGAILSRAR